MTACNYIESIVGGIDLDWPGTPMLTVKQKYDSDSFDHVAIPFTLPKKLNFEAVHDCG